MRHFLRAAAILGAGLVLLAADEAPLSLDTGDISGEFGTYAADEPATAPMTPDSAFEVIDQTPPHAAPEIGPLLPQAATLAGMVAELRDAGPIDLDDEMLCLATAVYFEAKGEPLDGQLAVAQVILNRVEAGRFGRDICAVVKAPRQFSFVRGGAMPAPRGAAQWETAQAIALIAAGGGWREIVGEATHFHATYVNPGWKMRRVATVGRHIFYR
jgi:hypothetical protein